MRPELAIENGVYTSIKVKQEAPLVPVGSTELRPHRLAVGLYDIKEGALVRRKSAEIDLAGASTIVEEFAGEKVADLVLLNDRDLTYGKIRFDEKSITTLKEHLGDLQDPLSRALCWSAVWDMLRDGELSASDYVPLVLNALAGEADAAVVQMTLVQLDSAVELFAANHNRTKLRAEEAIGIEALLDGTELGSDLQLIFARAFASTATSTDQITKIRSMLDGNIEGLVVDADLRWHLLNCLIERGAATSEELEAELEIDNTANGQRYAAFARAAFPTPEVKVAAFDAAIKSGLSNHIQLATIRGFQRSTQRELLADFADRYFEIILDMWNNETYEMASNVAMLLYPTYIISQETLAKTEKWLATSGEAAPSGLRRIVAENRDAMARALNAQAKDAQ